MKLRPIVNRTLNNIPDVVQNAVKEYRINSTEFKSKYGDFGKTIGENNGKLSAFIDEQNKWLIIQHKFNIAEKVKAMNEYFVDLTSEGLETLKLKFLSIITPKGSLDVFPQEGGIAHANLILSDNSKHMVAEGSISGKITKAMHVNAKGEPKAASTSDEFIKTFEEVLS